MYVCRKATSAYYCRFSSAKLFVFRIPCKSRGQKQALFGTFSMKCDEMQAIWYEWQCETLAFSEKTSNFANERKWVSPMSRKTSVLDVLR